VSRSGLMPLVPARRHLSSLGIGYQRLFPSLSAEEELILLEHLEEYLSENRMASLQVKASYQGSLAAFCSISRKARAVILISLFVTILSVIGLLRMLVELISS
jgi:hypothetical protein